MKRLILPGILALLLSQCIHPAPPAPPQEEKTAEPKALRAPEQKKTNLIHRMQNGEGTVYLPPGLCYLDEVAPGIIVDLKYCGNDNFVGRTIAGYATGRRAILRKDAAESLKRAQSELAKKGLGLLVWDAYRPHRAMVDFYEWSQSPDESKKAEFYPNISKAGIYENKYIRRKSEHSYGVAVDVTLISLATGQELDMGGRHDFLDATSATRYTGLTPEQHANRMLLRDTMDRAGMRNYKREWWHYFLKDKGSVTRYDFPLCDTLIDKP